MSASGSDRVGISYQIDPRLANFLKEGPSGQLQTRVKTLAYLVLGKDSDISSSYQDVLGRMQNSGSLRVSESVYVAAQRALRAGNLEAAEQAFLTLSPGGTSKELTLNLDTTATLAKAAVEAAQQQKSTVAMSAPSALAAKRETPRAPPEEEESPRADSAILERPPTSLQSAEEPRPLAPAASRIEREVLKGAETNVCEFLNQLQPEEARIAALFAYIKTHHEDSNLNKQSIIKSISGASGDKFYCSQSAYHKALSEITNGQLSSALSTLRAEYSIKKSWLSGLYNRLFSNTISVGHALQSVQQSSGALKQRHTTYGTASLKEEEPVQRSAPLFERGYESGSEAESESVQQSSGALKQRHTTYGTASLKEEEPVQRSAPLFERGYETTTKEERISEFSSSWKKTSVPAESTRSDEPLPGELPYLYSAVSSLILENRVSAFLKKLPPEAAVTALLCLEQLRREREKDGAFSIAEPVSLADLGHMMREVSKTGGKLTCSKAAYDRALQALGNDRITDALEIIYQDAQEFKTAGLFVRFFKNLFSSKTLSPAAALEVVGRAGRELLPPEKAALRNWERLAKQEANDIGRKYLQHTDRGGRDPNIWYDFFRDHIRRLRKDLESDQEYMIGCKIKDRAAFEAKYLLDRLRFVFSDRLSASLLSHDARNSVINVTSLLKSAASSDNPGLILSEIQKNLDAIKRSPRIERLENRLKSRESNVSRAKIIEDAEKLLRDLKSKNQVIANQAHRLLGKIAKRIASIYSSKESNLEEKIRNNISMALSSDSYSDSSEYLKIAISLMTLLKEEEDRMIDSRPDLRFFNELAVSQKASRSSRAREIPPSEGAPTTVSDIKRLHDMIEDRWVANVSSPLENAIRLKESLKSRDQNKRQEALFEVKYFILQLLKYNNALKALDVFGTRIDRLNEFCHQIRGKVYNEGEAIQFISDAMSILRRLQEEEAGVFSKEELARSVRTANSLASSVIFGMESFNESDLKQAIEALNANKGSQDIVEEEYQDFEEEDPRLRNIFDNDTP